MRTSAVLFPIVAGFAVLMGPVDPCYASDHDSKVVSHVGQASLVALAVGDTAVQCDRNGGESLVLSLAATEAETYARLTRVAAQRSQQPLIPLRSYLHLLRRRQLPPSALRLGGWRAGDVCGRPGRLVRQLWVAGPRIR